jgi:hypothetical protein
VPASPFSSSEEEEDSASSAAAAAAAPAGTLGGMWQDSMFAHEEKPDFNAGVSRIVVGNRAQAHGGGGGHALPVAGTRGASLA